MFQSIELFFIYIKNNILNLSSTTIKINTCDKDWFGRDYVFYDKNGNSINILYDQELDLYKGKLYFPENSSDTNEVLEINTFERIKGFEYQQYSSDSNDQLFTQKFQLFNTDKIEFIGNSYSVDITRIESVNNDPNFKSKWLYGTKVDYYFPLGTEIKLNRDIFGISSNETYTVVNSKKDAILIITNTDNKTFNSNIGGIINDPNQYNNLSISGVNAIKMYNYLDSDFKNNYPSWSEPNFYTNIFKNQKLSIVNSDNNSGIFTVKSKTLGDNYYSNYKILIDDLNGDLTISVTNKTSNFNIYNGTITFVDNLLKINEELSQLFKPGVKLSVPESSLNNKILTIDNIVNFNKVNTYYSDGGTISNPDQVLYLNNIYECIQSYTQSATSSITPLDTDYWLRSKSVPIVETTINETINGDLFLQSNKVDLPYIYNTNLTKRVNLANAFELHIDSLDILGLETYIDPLGEYGILKSKYPTDYVGVEYFINIVDSFSGSTTNGTNFSPTGFTLSYDPHETTSINVTVDNNNILTSEDYLSSNAWVYFSNTGSASSLTYDSLDSNTELYWKGINAGFGLTPSSIVNVSYVTEVSVKENIIERIIEIDEDLVNEKRVDVAERTQRILVLSDIDEYGLNIIINEQVYNIDSTLLYRGNGELDIEESIDATLREWLTKWRIELDKRGITAVTEYYGNNNNTSLINSIKFIGDYPNVDIDININVGDTADFYFPDQSIIFYQSGVTGSQLNIEINGRSYLQAFSQSISNTLSSWVSTHTEFLNDIGIYVNSKNSLLEISKKTNIDIEVNVNLGINFLPGEKVFEKIKYWKGYEGVIITSNSIIQNNNEVNFEEECFSTGQIISINNSEEVLNNQEYNIVYLNPDRMILSYQGAFWGSINNSISNAFFNLSFGDDLEIGDYILAVIDNNTFTGSVTKVGSDYYQFVTNNNNFLTVTRQNSFGYDENANNISIPPEDEVTINLINSDTNITDIDYFYTSDTISIISDEINFIESEDARLSSTIGLSQSVIKQVINPVNNYLYALTTDYVYIIDPITETLKTTINNIGTEGWDIECDYTRGDVYISYGGTSSFDDRIMVIYSDLTLETIDYYSNYRYGKLRYNRDEDSLYVFSRQNEDIGITSSKVIYKIDLEDNSAIDGDFLVSTYSNIGMGYTGSTASDSYLGGGKYLNGNIIFNEFNGSMYITNNNYIHRIDTSNSELINTGIYVEDYYSYTLDPFNKYLWISNSDGILYAISEDNNIVKQVNISTYGYILCNPKDSHLYLSTVNGDNSLKVFTTKLDQIFFSFGLDYELEKIIYNISRDSIIGYNSSQTNAVDIKIDFIFNSLKGFSNAFDQSSFASEIFLNDINKNSSINDVEYLSSENLYGTLEENYENNGYLLLKTRDSIRTPRDNYSTTGSKQSKWVYKWESDQVNEIYMVDISGDFLPTSGSYAYVGQKPLSNPVIKRTPNKDVKMVDESYAQQTVFDSLTYSLDYNDSSTNISFYPKGIQTILGLSSKQEGVVNNKLNIHQYEDISITFPTYDSYTSSNFSITLPKQEIIIFNNDETGYGEIILSTFSTDLFSEIIDLNNLTSSNTNLDENHNIKLSIIDDNNQYFSNNNSIEVKIIDIFKRKLIVRYLDREFENETLSNGIKLKIDVMPRKVVEFDIYGQTEIEDPRFKIELTNIGKNINPEDIYIFKDYDINEGGIDWRIMNKKRKEMLIVKNEIYNYIGAYRSIINSINFFGYNDLELYEYFVNIDSDSPDLNKLSKVEIPDIFDNTVEGWSENYKFWQYPNKKYEETKLFNLTYKLTDFDGNKLTTYSIEEVLIKLRGLKKWLEKNVVPLTHKILDITGRSDFKQELQAFDTPSMVNVININDKIWPVDFDIKETYVLPVQSGSTVYNTVIDFQIGSTNSNVGTSSIPEYFELTLRTYKIYDEWDPFVSYSYEDKVAYFGKIYQNVLTDPTASALGQDPTAIKNTNNNPRIYENSENWNINTNYKDGDIVYYKRRYYKYSLKTTDANYLPWEGATGSCLTGTPSQTNNIDDNFYTDLVDRIGNEQNIPNYWEVDEANVDSNFDVLDIVKNNYPTQWCDLVQKDSALINNIAIDMVNLPSNQYQGDKPTTIADATLLIIQMIDDYVSTKSLYKFKFASYTPEQNLLLDNPDFILWDDITEWLEVDMDPVQYIKEYRSGDDMLLPYNFTLDTKIDPYVVIECRSDNGYGQIKNIKKSYEIKYDADSDDILIKTIRS
jgi:hypothetical protein